ncbi:MAG: DUF2852 domain-containing protein [Xanthobacteraceae bacterium]|jgi:hypothetical protein|nr:DUF2852 domain-containing protein [Xanthobacteraceae bacterium]
MSDTAQFNRWGRPDWEDRHPRFFESAWHPGRILLTVLAFIVWWPLGLALLFFTLGSRSMGCRSHFGENRWQEKMERLQWKMDRVRERMESHGFGGGRGGFGRSSGNRAFDEYKQDTLRRLEEEQAEFKTFLDRLRHAKDKAEFDQFMAEHRTRPTSPPEAGAQQG